MQIFCDLKVNFCERWAPENNKNKPKRLVLLATDLIWIIFWNILIE